MSIVNAVSTPFSIPLGFMMSASEYGTAGSRVKGMVLEQMVNFDPLSYLNSRRSMFDVCLVSTTGEPLLMFLLQIDDARLIWLANPAESAVWEAIDVWKANRSVPVALTNSSTGTHVFGIPYQHRLDESVLALRRNKRLAAGQLTRDACAILVAGTVENYEIPGLPAPAHSVACLLHTAGVDKALKRLGYCTEWDAEACTFHARRITDDTPADMTLLSLH